MRASTTRGSSSSTRIDARDRGADIRTGVAAGRRRARQGRVARDAGRAGRRAFEVRARALVNAAGPWVKDVLGSVRGRVDARDGAPREGQPHRGAARARRAARVHPAERRPAHRVRHPVAGPLFADRHDRRSGGHVRAIPRSPTPRSTTCCELANGYLAKPLSRADIALDVQRRAPAVRRRRRRSVRHHARLRAEARGARWCAGRRPRAGAVGVRRQDHHLSQARRARARRARAVLPADEARVDRASARCPAATCRPATAPRCSPRSSPRIRACPSTCCAASRVATARALRASSPA